MEAEAQSDLTQNSKLLLAANSNSAHHPDASPWWSVFTSIEKKLLPSTLCKKIHSDPVKHSRSALCRTQMGDAQRKSALNTDGSETDH